MLINDAIIKLGFGINLKRKIALKKKFISLIGSQSLTAPDEVKTID